MIFGSKLPPDKIYQPISPSTGKLTVVITGFHSDSGEVSVSLFNQANAFPKQSEKALAIVYSKINNRKSETVFRNLPIGEYAISVFHDENNNKKMDSNLFGIPKEGVGASNNARGHFGPPKYEDAKFFFNGSDLTISISITYL
jgi:uncharacterized protein (DUF2141 family)